MPNPAVLELHWWREGFCAFVRARRTELLIALTVLGSCAYFFQGGGWNQNAHFATTVALAEDGSLSLERYRASTGDLSRSPDGVVSAKPIGTALAMVPGYLIAKAFTWPIQNIGNRNIARAYLTAVLGPGVALALLAVLLFGMMRRRLREQDAMLVALAMTLATPLFPFSTMTNSTPFVALTALWGYSLLEGPRLRAAALSTPRLVLAGLAAGLPAVFEYQTAVVVLPLGAYAFWQLQRKQRIRWFVLGVAVAAIIPLTHHTIVYGNPFHVGYASLVVPGFARDAARGWMGIEGPTLHRLYNLTLGSTRGYLFVSPFLIAAVPGLVRMIRSPELRPEGLVAGGAAWLMVLVVASLAYWHSGWGITSRYGILFVAFCAVPLAAIFEAHRRWILLGMGLGFAFMLLAASVTATPPPPGPRPAHLTVVEWLFDQLAAGKVAFRNEAVLQETGIGKGEPTWRTSFNLGQAVGLEGKLSLLPYLLFVGVCLRLLWTRTTSETPDPSPAA